MVNTGFTHKESATAVLLSPERQTPDKPWPMNWITGAVATVVLVIVLALWGIGWRFSWSPVGSSVDGCTATSAGKCSSPLSAASSHASCELVSSDGSVPSNRYIENATGEPTFFMGYYAWAAVDPDRYIDHPARYEDMIRSGAKYGINYIRISLGINRFDADSDPPSWDGAPNPVPFKYENDKYNLDEWDPDFWDGLRSTLMLARDPNGDGSEADSVMVHLSIFDGVAIRGGREAYRWPGSFWNRKNQASDYFGQLDNNNNGNADENGEFYRLDDFNNNVNVGFYQRKLIDKMIAETDEFDNVFYEIGNELFGSSAEWNQAVIDYLRAITDKAITQNQGERAADTDGWSQHKANTPAQVKDNVAKIVCLGYPAWEDPDGPDLAEGTPDDLRRSAWYSFIGGAAGWGGFTYDFWTDGSGFSEAKAKYYQYLTSFIQKADLQLDTMLPHHELVSNSKENSVLAAPGSIYIVYVLNDDSVTVDLANIHGMASAHVYNPQTGQWSNKQNINGGNTRTFSKPANSDDWVLYIVEESTATIPVPTGTPVYLPMLNH